MMQHFGKRSKSAKSRKGSSNTGLQRGSTHFFYSHISSE